MKEHKVFAIQSTPNAKHQWVLSEKRTFFVNLNRCTETGDVQLISDLPLTEAELRKIMGV